MDLGIKGKTAVVSGSTAGIGFAIAATLAAEGAWKPPSRKYVRNMVPLRLKGLQPIWERLRALRDSWNKSQTRTS